MVTVQARQLLYHVTRILFCSVGSGDRAAQERTQKNCGISILEDFDNLDGQSQGWPELLLIRAQVFISNLRLYIQ